MVVIFIIPVLLVLSHHLQVSVKPLNTVYIESPACVPICILLHLPCGRAQQEHIVRNTVENLDKVGKSPGAQDHQRQQKTPSTPYQPSILHFVTLYLNPGQDEILCPTL